MPDSAGFIGLGNMGGPIARRLADQGYPLFVHDQDERRAAPFASRTDTTICASPREVAQRASVVLLSLPTPRALSDVVLGSEGVAAGIGDGCVIDLSTSGVRATRAVAAELVAQSISFLEAPVSGGVAGATGGTLSVMVAGDAGLYEVWKPLLSVIGTNVFYIGATPGQGQAMKLVNNILTATAMAATAEAMTVATKAGIPPALALDILNVSTGQNTATRDKFPRAVLTGTFDYGASTALMLKDVKLFEELAEELGTPTIVSEAVVNAWRIAVQQGFGADDFTAIARLFERWSGVEIRSTPSGHRGP